MTSTTTSTTIPDVTTLRAHFPALDSPLAFLENAGGSQVPRCVADAIRAYMLERYVQLGAGYPLSREADDVIDRAHAFADLMVNAGNDGLSIIGPSTTRLVGTLAGAYADLIEPGDEIVIAEAGHEANIGPWAELEKRGAVIRWWKVDPETGDAPLDALDEVLSERTRLVAMVHVSNLLGAIVDLDAVTARAHAVGARVVADGVAYAPHRAIDVAGSNVDWYVYSAYKVYGPHMAVMYGRHDALAELRGPNHFFVPDSELPYKFEPGGVCHEGCAGLLALNAYLNEVVGRPVDAEPDRVTIEAAFARFTELELPMQSRLVEALAERDDVRVVGPGHGDETRVGTISFVPLKQSADAVAAALQARGLALRHGHMYAYRLCEAMNIAPEPGVVRISLTHYNTMGEIDRVIDALGEVLAS